MLTGLQEILADAKDRGYAVPGFNVYNMETVMGVITAAEEYRAPVILQFYSRLATSGVASYLAPVILQAAKAASVPVCMHLDHGENEAAAQTALACGATGIMIDYSQLDLPENIRKTAAMAQRCAAIHVGVEGEIGHIGRAADGIQKEYTTVDDAVAFVKGTGVAALAVMVGTAHGRYKSTPELAISRIGEIAAAVDVPLVLHGGSGVPEGQIKAAIRAGIVKVNFGTDLCYAFLDSVFTVDRSIFAIDLFMREPVAAVKSFAAEKIRILGADHKA